MTKIKQTSSLSIEDKKFIITWCFLGNLRHKDLKRRPQNTIETKRLQTASNMTFTQQTTLVPTVSESKYHWPV